MEHSLSQSNVPSNPVDLLSVQHEEYQAQIAQLQQQIHNQQQEIERYQSQFDEVLAEFEQCHFELHQTQSKLHHLESELEQTKLLLNQSQQNLEKSELQSVPIQQEISWDQFDQSSSEIFTTYRSIIEQNPDCPQGYQDLAAALLQQGYWVEAISCYRRSIILNPDYQKQCFLDQVIGKFYSKIHPQQLSILPEQKTEITSLGHILSFAGNEGFVLCGPYIDIPDGLYRIQVTFQFPEADQSNNEDIGFIFDVVSPHPQILYETSVNCSQNKLEFYLEFLDGKRTEFRFFAKGIAFIVKEIELTLIYSPEFNTNAPFYYFDLGSIWQNKGFMDKASLAYNRAIELSAPISVIERLVNASNYLPLKPEWIDAYWTLGYLLNQQNYIDEAIACYQHLVEIAPQKTEAFHQLGILLAQRGQLKEAVTLFQKAQRPSSLGEIYQQIWKGLNQFAPLDENNPYFQVDLQPDTAYEYFSQTSQYRIIVLESLTEADQAVIKESGLVLDYLQFLTQDSIALQEVYLNHFPDSQPKNLANQYPKKVVDYNFLCSPHYQQSIVETGYIYSVCPVSGKILRSNQSFWVQHTSFVPVGFYRFCGYESFYLICGCHQGIALGVYFPKQELIIRFYNDPFSTDYAVAVNEFKAGAVSFWRDVKTYISSSERKPVAAILGWLNNLGHYFWNDVTGVYHLYKNNILNSVDKFVIRDSNFMGIGDIFPEINPETILQVSNRWQLFQTILQHNLVAVRPTNTWIDSDYTQRLLESSRRKCSVDFLQQVEEAKQHFPLLLVNLRGHFKQWVSYIEGYAHIINALFQDYPNLAIVFDGFSSETSAMEQIQSLISPEIKTYNALDCPNPETFVWIHSIDTYIMVIGSGLTLVTWIANKPGVAHGNLAHCHQLNVMWRKVRDDLQPILVPQDAIVDLDESHWPGCNYDCDWKAIYNLTVEVIKSLETSQPKS